MWDSYPIVGIPMWAWIILAAIFVGGPALVIASAVALRALTSRSAFRAPGADAARTHASHVTWSELAGLGGGLLIGIVLVVNQRGILAPLACGGGYLVGLLAGEYWAQPPAWGTRRAAGLLVRRATDYVPRVAGTAIAVTTLLTLAVPIAFGLAPSINYPPFAVSAEPRIFLTSSTPTSIFPMPGGLTAWPGWTITVGGAALSVAALLLGAGGLRRIAARPQPVEGAAHDIDELQRRQASSAITGAVLGLQLIVLAALLIEGSSGLAVPVARFSPGAYLGSRIMIWAGLGCAAAGAVAWLTLSGWIGRAHRDGDGPPAEPGSSPGSGPASARAIPGTAPARAEG
jgi:hypothetical protein